LLVALVFFQFHVAMPLDMKRQGVSTHEYGLLVALNGLLVVLLSPFATTLMLRLPRRSGLAVAAGLTGLGFGMFAFAGSIAVYAASITVLTLGEIAFAPLHPAVVAGLAPVRLRGTYQGAFQLSFSLAMCVAPIIGGAVLEQGRGTWLWAGCFGVASLAAGLYWLMPLSPAGQSS